MEIEGHVPSPTEIRPTIFFTALEFSRWTSF